MNLMKLKIVNMNGYPKELKKKYHKHGIDVFTDREIVELLLLYARPLNGVRNLADNLISQYGDFQQLLDEPLNSLVAFPGMNADTGTLLKLIRDCSSYYLKKKPLKIIQSGAE